MRLIPLLSVAVLVFAAAGPAVAQDDVDEAKADFIEVDEGIQWWFENAHGYAIFPSVGKGAIGIGGARGKGYVYEQGELVGKSTLTQVTVGFQLGGQAYREVVFFKDDVAMEDFKRGNFELSAQASAVALTAGASGDISYSGGVAIVTIAKGGLMYEASVGGQKFDYDPSDEN
jgi:lipid-binding SYLF domain-containing protein